MLKEIINKENSLKMVLFFAGWALLLALFLTGCSGEPEISDDELFNNPDNTQFEKTIQDDEEQGSTEYTHEDTL